MSENSKPTPQSDEVDLGQLFNIIGQLFKDLFKFFESILKGMFRIVIYALKPFVNNIKIVASVLVLSAVIGFFVEKNETGKVGTISSFETKKGFNNREN